MDMLFVADVMKRDLRDVLAEEQAKALHEPEREASWRYAREIVEGYLEHEVDIDVRIEATANGWTLERMPSVDAAILRIGVWEILHNDEVPVEVAINEAITAASEYSTDDSSRFISGVLGTIADGASAA